MSAPPVNIPYLGGCFCGAIRYEGTEAPIAISIVIAETVSARAEAPLSRLHWFDNPACGSSLAKLKYHRAIGEGGRWTDRGLCAECGTPLFAKGERAPGYITIKPGA